MILQKMVINPRVLQAFQVAHLEIIRLLLKFKISLMIMIGEWTVEAQLHVFFSSHFFSWVISNFQLFLNLFSIPDIFGLDFLRLDYDLLSRILLINFKVFTW